jgi:hypothetical protein
MRKYRLILALVIVAAVLIYGRMRSDAPGTTETPVAVEEVEAALPGLMEVEVTPAPEGYTQLLGSWNGRFTKAGWNHYGPGHFELDPETGVLKGHGGMGLFWYSVKEFSDFVLELEFLCSDADTNSGVFVRVPGVPTSDDYIYHSFEIQIYDAGEDIHMTGAAYDAEAPTHLASNPPGEWNHFKITFVGSQLSVELNGEAILDWEAEGRGKVEDFAPSGYIGLQNHDDRSPVYFRNLFVKELG